MAEIIAEPTALSKVIPLKFKINDVDVPKTTQLSTNKQFNTTDTDAWFTFELDGLASTSGTYDLTLINLDDKSIFHHADVIFPALPFHYKLNSSEDVTLNEIRHAGRWLGQLVVTMANGDTTARQFGFNISGHILDGQDAQVILLSDYQALINTINLAKDDLTQYNVDYAALIADVDAAEAIRAQAEIDRAATFNALVESEMVAQNIATKLTEKEATFAPRMLSLEEQLEQAATKAELSAIATPKAVTLVAQMTDVAKIYVYTGIEGGYTAGNWYYHNGTAWVSGGVYQSTGITDGSITEVKLATSAVTNAKLGDRYNAVRLLTAGENVLSISREGVYYKETATSVIGLPTELSVDKSVFLEVSTYNNLNYVQTAVDTSDHNYKYVRIVRAGVDKGWIKYASEAKIDAKLALTHVTDTERMLKNFEKYRADTPTSTLYDMLAAIQDIEVIGLDPSLPLKFWVVCRQYSTWGYRIMMGQKVDGAWVTVLDTGTTIPVTESALGSTFYSFTSSGGVTLRMRIDYRAIPVGGRILQGASMTEEPYYIISPKCVKLSESQGVGEAYDQSLNTTDNVQFNTVTASNIITDTLQVGGTIQTGTLATPPAGLLSGDMWADTTDSATHPIVRVMV